MAPPQGLGRVNVPNYKLKQPPAGIMIVKTSKKSWIALTERWEGDLLTDVIPMRAWDGGPIVQGSERRDVLQKIELAMAATRIQELEAALKRARSGGREGDSDAQSRVSPSSSLARRVS